MPKRKPIVARLKEADAEAAVEADARVRALRKEIDGLKRQLRERQTGDDLIVNAIQEIWQDPAEVQLVAPPKPVKGVDATETAVLHLSDIHVGKRTASFDSAIAAERVRLAVAKTLEITDLRRHTARIDECRLLLGGDIIEGEEIFPTQAHEIDSHLLEQAVKRAPEILAEAVLSLANHFARLRVVATPGNHGRNGPRHGRAHHRTNWDSVAYEVCRRIVVSSVADHAKRIAWDLPADRNEEWYAHDTVHGWGVLLVHGHQVRGQLGFPWYGYGKKVSGWIDSIPARWDYLFSGHFHTLARFELNRRTVLANGACESDNTFARENMAAAGYPTQRLCFFNERHGMIVDSPLSLSDERKPCR